MKRLVCFFLVFPVFLFSLGGCSMPTEPQYIKIAVIVKSSTSFFWETVFKGIETADNEYSNVDIISRAPGREDDYEAQNEFIREAIHEEKVNAIIFSASNYTKSSEAIQEAINAGIRVVTIDSGIGGTVESPVSVPYIGTNNYLAGKQAGEAMDSFLGGRGELGVISFEEETGNGTQRVEGLQAFIEENPGYNIVDIQYASSNKEDPYTKTREMVKKYPNLDGIITFNELTTLGVGEAINELELSEKITVVGFDNNLRSVYMLEKGVVDALIVQNPFAMGYLGVQTVISGFNTGQSMESIDTSTDIITKENMFNITKQKILFPFIG